MSEVKRIEVGQRMSQAVIHGNTVYLAGQVALRAPGESVAAQTSDILARIEELLAAAGTSKEKALTATIWLCSMDDFAEMNEVWDAWAADGQAPCRACVESPRLAAPQFTVEIQVTAAL
jgi:enamine deaminase RidA (YjgF/YER057c/UK114 family)